MEQREVKRELGRFRALIEEEEKLDAKKELLQGQMGEHLLLRQRHAALKER